MRSICIRVAQVAVTVILGVTILVSLGLWRLSQGPVSLNFLAPALERSFAVRDTSFAVEVDDTSLVWGGWKRVIDIRSRNVRVFAADGNLVALLPDVSIGLSFSGLMRGDLAVSRLDVFGLRAVLERFPDGRFGFQMPTDADGTKKREGALADAAEDFLRPMRERTGPFRYLQRFSVLEGRFQFIDRMTGQIWAIPKAEIITEFLPDAIETRLALGVDADGQRMRLLATILHDRRSRRIGGRVDFDRLEPSVIARAFPYLNQLADIRAAFSGNVNFEIAHDWQLLGLRLQLLSDFGQATFAMAYPSGSELVQVSARLNAIRLASLARATPALSPLAGLDIPVSGVLEGVADPTGLFQLTDVDLTSGAGQVDLPGVFSETMKIVGARLSADIDGATSTAKVREFSIDFGGTKVSTAGRIRRDETGYEMAVDGSVAALPLRDLGKYWPPGVGVSARQWVTSNIVDGTVTDGTVSLALKMPVENDKTTVSVESIDGTLQYQGLSIKYWEPLPKVADVGGTATFDAQGFKFAVSSGRLKDLALEKAAVDITGLNAEDQAIMIDAALRGSARSLAEILDRKPLGYVSEIGISPAAISGEAVVRTKFEFPLITDLDAKDITITASAGLGKLAVSPAPFGLTPRDGDIRLKVNNAGLSATGTMRLFASPATIDWREDFRKDAKVKTNLVVSGRLPDLSRPGFGVPPTDMIKGPSDVNVVVTARSDGSTEILAGFELADAAVDLKEVGWTKPIGVPGTANVVVSLDEKGVRAVDKFSVEAGTTKLLGSAKPRARDRAAWRVDIEQFKNAGSDLSGRIDIGASGEIAATVSGGRFDVGPILDAEDQKNEQPPNSEEPGLRLNARFDELRWGPDRKLRQANLLLHRQKGAVRGLVLDGRLGKQGKLDVKFLPGPDGQILRIVADDFGEILSMSPTKGRVSGGTLLIRGIRRSPDAPIEGDFIASKFTLSKAPTLAKVLQVASLTGIGAAMSKKGLDFDAFEGRYVYKGDRVTFSKASAHGSSIGVTVNGILDLDADTANLGGTLVPAYSFNRAIGKIPVIGSLLTGGENEGVFAATYRVAGPLENPKISVNPLSALAPGFLRNLFGLGAGKPQGETPAN